MSQLQGLVGGGIDLSRSREVSGKDWCNEGAEDNLSTAIRKY